MSNACSSCESKKVCNYGTESDSFEVCYIKEGIKKAEKKLKTEKQKVIETGRY